VVGLLSGPAYRQTKGCEVSGGDVRAVAIDDGLHGCLLV